MDKAIKFLEEILKFIARTATSLWAAICFFGQCISKGPEEVVSTQRNQQAKVDEEIQKLKRMLTSAQVDLEAFQNLMLQKDDELALIEREKNTIIADKQNLQKEHEALIVQHKEVCGMLYPVSKKMVADVFCTLIPQHFDLTLFISS